MASKTTEPSPGPHPWPLPIYAGFAVGAAVGFLVHLAGLDGWASVPIAAGIGGGVGSVVAWRRTRLPPQRG